MEFALLRDELVANGYESTKAEAKIAHDIVLAAIRKSGFHDKITIKGGVVMGGLTNDIRRATMDMDVDFLRYSLDDESIRRFVRRISRVAGCDVSIDGDIVELRQQEYRGKRLYLLLADERGYVIRTKLDIGVHSNKEVEQDELVFKVITEDDVVELQINSREQIFVEKLKSLLKMGSLTTRYKDVYDLFYLKDSVDRELLKRYIEIYIFSDVKMRERSAEMMSERLRRIFLSKKMLNGLASRKHAWLDIPIEELVDGLSAFVGAL